MVMLKAHRRRMCGWIMAIDIVVCMNSMQTNPADVSTCFNGLMIDLTHAIMMATRYVQCRTYNMPNLTGVIVFMDLTCIVISTASTVIPMITIVCVNLTHAIIVAAMAAQRSSCILPDFVGAMSFYGILMIRPVCGLFMTTNVVICMNSMTNWVNAVTCYIILPHTIIMAATDV